MLTVSGISNIFLNYIKTPFKLPGSRNVHHGCAWRCLKDMNGNDYGLISVTFTALPWVIWGKLRHISIWRTVFRLGNECGAFWIWRGRVKNSTDIILCKHFGREISTLPGNLLLLSPRYKTLRGYSCTRRFSHIYHPTERTWMTI